MESSAELIALIHQIRNATSPLHRLKLTALAWRTLRSLAPVDRLAVAKAIGLEGAERLVEQLGSHGGVSPSLLLGAIQRAEKADPAELERLLRELKDPAERAELLSGAAAELERRIAPDDDDAISPAPPPLPTPTDPEPPPPQPAPAPAPEPPSGVASDAAPTVATAPPPPPRRPQPSPRTAPPRRPSPVAKPARVKRSAVTADGAAVSQHAAGRRHRGASAPRPDLAAVLAATDGTFARLRRLTRLAGDAAGLAGPELAAVVAVFPPGWQRRRALEALIRTGVVTDADTLLELLADAGPRTVAWALSALAERGELADGDLAKLEAASPPHPIRHHLAHRRARGR